MHLQFLENKTFKQKYSIGEIINIEKEKTKRGNISAQRIPLILAKNPNTAWVLVRSDKGMT